MLTNYQASLILNSHDFRLRLKHAQNALIFVFRMRTIDGKSLPSLNAYETCFLVVDMQNDFVKPEGYFGKKGQNMKPVLDSVIRIAEFLEFCRDKGPSVIFLKTEHPRYTNADTWRIRLGDEDESPNICLPNSWGAEIIDELTPSSDEPVVVKRRYDGFLETDLPVILRTWRIQNLLIAGTKTNVCVDTTVRHAFMDDYLTVTLSDCVSTPDVGLQGVTLMNIANYFGFVKTSEEVRRSLVFGPEKIGVKKIQVRR